jgi:hypothetical protein
MKKIITTFVLLCVIFPPKPTFSQNSLQDIIKQFEDTEKQLRYLSIDLHKITDSSSNWVRNNFNLLVANSIGSSSDIMGHAVDLIVLSQPIKEKQKLVIYIYIKSRLSMLKKRIEFEISDIQTKYYAGIENRAALNLIDKAKEKMRGSLSLFDRSIEVLNINKIKAP